MRNCENGWKKVVSLGKTQCLKYIGEHEAGKAASECSFQNAKLPLPTNEQENLNLKEALFYLEIPIIDGKRRAVLDASDHVKEGEWRSSDGNLLSFSDWGANEGPYNKRNPLIEDHVTLYVPETEETGLTTHWADYSSRTVVTVVCVKG